jgi:ABC-2 type transport system ATP-binding protein
MHEPDLLVLDEPTSGLDPFLQQEFVHLVQAAKRRGATVFMSSHVMSKVQQTADRVGIIRDGTLVTVRASRRCRNARYAPSR